MSNNSVSAQILIEDYATPGGCKLKLRNNLWHDFESTATKLIDFVLRNMPLKIIIQCLTKFSSTTSL